MTLEDHAEELLDLLDSANPAIRQGVAPTNGQVPVYNSTTKYWDGGVNAIGLTVPQAHQAATGAPSAASGAAVATTGSSQTTPYGYTTSAQADAIVTALNHATADIAALVIELGTLTTAFNLLLTHLATAGITS